LNNETYLQMKANSWYQFCRSPSASPYNRKEQAHKRNNRSSQDWKVKTHKLAQKDVDALWTKKNNKDKNLLLYADSAYTGEE